MILRASEGCILRKSVNETSTLFYKASGAVVMGGVTLLIGNPPRITYSDDGMSSVISPPGIASLAYGGGGLVAAGLIEIIPRATNRSVGKKKVREYQIKLDDFKSGAYFSPDQVSVKLAFKF